MKKYIGVLLLLFGVCLLALPLTVLAETYTHYIQIGIFNNASPTFSHIPVLISLNNTQLYDQGYILSTGLDTSMLEGATDKDYMAGGVRLGTVVAGIEGYQAKTRTYRLGVDPAQSDYWFVSGVGGDSTTLDNDTLEPLTSDFTLQWKGYLNTGTTGSIVDKDAAYGLEVSVAGTVRGYVEGTGTQAVEYLYPDSDDTVALTPVGEASNYLCVDDVQGAPDEDATYIKTTSTSYLWDKYTLTDSVGPDADDQIDEVRVYYRFKLQAVAGTGYAVPRVHLGGDETAGTPTTNVTTTYADHDEALARPGGGSWTTADLDSLKVSIGLKHSTGATNTYCTQVYVKVTYTPKDWPEVTKAVGSGEHTLILSQVNGTVGLTVDSVSAGTDTLDLTTVETADNGNNIVMDGDIAVATEYVKLRIWEPNNPGFEYGDWPTAGSGSVSAAQAHSGTYSYLLTAAGADIAGSFSEYIKVKPSTTYDFSGWSYVSVLTTGDFYGWVYQYDVSKAYIGIGTAYVVTAAEGGWTYHTGSVVMPANCEYIRLVPYWWNAGGNPVGTAYTDDWSVTESGGSGGLQKMWYQPVTMVTGTTLPDRSPLEGNDGVITWGANPGAIEVTVTGLVSSTSYVAGEGEAGESPELVHDPDLIWYENSTEPEHMPLYAMFNNTAEALGWSTGNTYGVFLMIGALAGGVAIITATGSILGGAIGASVLLIVAGATGLVPFWVPLIFGLVCLMGILVWRSM